MIQALILQLHVMRNQKSIKHILLYSILFWKCVNANQNFHCCGPIFHRKWPLLAIGRKDFKSWWPIDIDQVLDISPETKCPKQTIVCNESEKGISTHNIYWNILQHLGYIDEKFQIINKRLTYYKCKIRTFWRNVLSTYLLCRS